MLPTNGPLQARGLSSDLVDLAKPFFKLVNKLYSHLSVYCYRHTERDRALGVLSVLSLRGLTLPQPHSPQLSASYNMGLILLLAKKGPRSDGVGRAMAGP